MSSLPSLRERAERTLNDIEERFALTAGHYRAKPGTNDPAFAWALGVLFSAFVAAAANIDRRRYEPRMRRHFDALQTYWHTSGPVPGYNASRVGPNQKPDRYYDDNAWFVLAFLDAHALTGDIAYERAAIAALRFVLSGYDTRTGGGLYWHEQNKQSKNTAAAAPGMAGAIMLAASERVPTGPWSVWTRRLYSWLRATLRDPADGLYWDNIRVSDKRINKTKWSYNSALVLRTELSLYDYWHAPVYRERAITLADACLGRWYDARTGILKDDASFAHLLAEALLQTYAVTGIMRCRDAVRISLDTLWTQVRRADGSYPKHWDPASKETRPTDLLWIASAARAYAYAIPFLERRG